MIFAKRFRYRFGDIDHAGIAYYPKLLHYFHCCFEDWWSEGLGHPYAELMRSDKLGLPAVRLEVDFMAPVRYGDEPPCPGRLRIGNSSVEFGYWFAREEGGRRA
jgi:4-hydroxybenzoyl-CoA thioesterase